MRTAVVPHGNALRLEARDTKVICWQGKSEVGNICFKSVQVWLTGMKDTSKRNPKHYQGRVLNYKNEEYIL